MAVAIVKALLIQLFLVTGAWGGNKNGYYTDPVETNLDVSNTTLTDGGTNITNGEDDKALNISGPYLVGKTFIMKSNAAIPQHVTLTSFSINVGNSTFITEGFLEGFRVV